MTHSYRFACLAFHLVLAFFSAYHQSAHGMEIITNQTKQSESMAPIPFKFSDGTTKNIPRNNLIIEKSITLQNMLQGVQATTKQEKVAIPAPTDQTITLQISSSSWDQIEKMLEKADSEKTEKENVSELQKVELTKLAQKEPAHFFELTDAASYLDIASLTPAITQIGLITLLKNSNLQKRTSEAFRNMISAKDILNTLGSLVHEKEIRVPMINKTMGDPSTIYDPQFSPSGKFLAFGKDTRSFIFDTTKWEKTKSGGKKNQNYTYSESNTGDVFTFDSKTENFYCTVPENFPIRKIMYGKKPYTEFVNRELNQDEVAKNLITHLRFTQDGDLLLIGLANQSILIFNDSLKLVQKYAPKKRVEATKISLYQETRETVKNSLLYSINSCLLTKDKKYLLYELNASKPETNNPLLDPAYFQPVDLAGVIDTKNFSSNILDWQELTFGEKNKTAVAVDDKGNYFAIATKENELMIWDITQKKAVSTYQMDRSSFRIAFVPDTEFLVVKAAGSKKKIIVFSYPQIKKIAELNDSGLDRSLAIDQLGRWLGYFYNDDEKNVTTFGLLDFSSLKSIDLHKEEFSIWSPPQLLFSTFSLDGNQIIFTTDNAKIVVFDLTNLNGARKQLENIKNGIENEEKSFLATDEKPHKKSFWARFWRYFGRQFIPQN